MFNLPTITRRSTRRAGTAVAVAAWATTAAAATAARGQATTGPATTPAERFVTGATVSASGTLSLRTRAVIGSADVRLRDVCRWDDVDAAGFAPLAELVVDHLGDGGSSRELSIDSLRSTLHDAGVNMAGVNLAGAAACVVTRDITVAAAPTAEPTDATPAAAAVVPASAGERPTAADAECNPFHTLRDRLVADAAQRLNLPAADLQVTFAPGDATLLNLSEPTFRFGIEPRRVSDLGRVSWDVTVMNGTATQRATVAAEARVWQTQVVVTSAAAYQQVLRDEDLVERRVLVSDVGQDPLLTRKQVVGQQAARDLRPGTVLTAKLIDPVPLARVGQFVTVTLCQGGVQVRTVARALQGGTYGQTIKVKSDATKDEFDVTLTGPQVANVARVRVCPPPGRGAPPGRPETRATPSTRESEPTCETV
jgi:flagella basal body P-ring formation protein FlgA